MAWWRVVLVCSIGAVGAVLTALLYVDAVSNERDIGLSTFRGTFSTFLQAFETFAYSQLRAVRAISDAVAAYGSLPPVAVLTTVMI